MFILRTYNKKEQGLLSGDVKINLLRGVGIRLVNKFLFVLHYFLYKGIGTLDKKEFYEDVFVGEK